MPRELAHNVSAEQCVIGACLQDTTALERIPELLPAHFYVSVHRYVFQAIQDTAGAGEAIDPVTVGQRLENLGLLKQVGGLGYLSEIAYNTPGATNVASYGRIVVEKARERELCVAVQDVQERLQGAGEVGEKVDYAQSRLMSLTAREDGGVVRVGDLRAPFLATMAQRATGEIVGVPTGFRDLDAMLGGLRPGNLVILAARPSMGKSSLAFQIAHRMAGNGRPVICFSMEMTALEVHDRLVAWTSGMPLSAITTGKPTGPGHVPAALDAMRDWPLEIDESPALTVRDIRSRCRAAMRRMLLKLVVVDYLQLMQGEGDTRNAQIETISRGLKALAKEIGVPVIALAQLSRKCEERPDHRPMLSDLRDSGGIEQDADVVMMIHREEVYRRQSTEWHGKAELLIRKNRQGPTGDVRLTWRGSHAAFDNFSGVWPDAGATGHAAPRRVAFAD